MRLSFWPTPPGSDHDADHWDELFLIAQQDDPDLSGLTEAEIVEVATIRSTLDQIDTMWRAPAESVRRVHDLFRAKLAAADPDHPWLQNRGTSTRGIRND